MKLKLIAIFAAALGAIGDARFAWAAKDFTSDDIMVAEGIAPLIANSNVDELEKLGNNLIDTKERLPDGRWKLDAFTKAFDLATPESKEPLYSQIVKLMEKWRAAYPNSRVAPVVLAHLYQRRAFNLRGGGFADEVWKENWDPFFEHLKKAKAALVKSKKTAQSNPRWYSTMIVVASALQEPRDKILEIAREGAAKNPTHLVTYLSTLNSLLPQWGGTIPQVKAWIEEASAIAKAIEGESLYARLYWDLYGSLRFSERADYNFDWKHIALAADDWVRRYPTRENLLTAVKISCHTMEPETVIKNLKALAKLNNTEYDSAVYTAEMLQLCDWKADPKHPGKWVNSYELRPSAPR